MQPLFVSFTAGGAAVCLLIAVWVPLFGRPFSADMIWIVVFLLVLGLFSWRMSRIGLYISDTAVRRQLFLWPRTIPWSEVGGIHTQTLMTPIGRRLEIWIDLKNGESVQTGVLFRDSLNSFMATEPSALTDNVTSAVAATRGREALDQLRSAHRKAAKA